MRAFARFIIIVCVFAFYWCGLLGTTALLGASADDWNKETKVTFSAPVEVPGVGAQVLPAGTYVFKLMDSPSNRHIVQIFNEKKTHVYTTILAIPNMRLKATSKTVITFKERAAGEPPAIRAWFYPGRKWGDEFVYSKVKAVELAKAANENVPYTPVEVATATELQTTPVEAMNPSGQGLAVPEIEVAAPPTETAATETAPAEVAKAEEPAALPDTASNLPLLTGLGILSIGAGIVLKKYSA